mmetsp:Transcript_15908/g.31929  ORF Transcript_15908/g.31929 Transcript_15908/m.31929 type:complete len:497 (-) Transcript_15908:748-2238(-)
MNNEEEGGSRDMVLQVPSGTSDLTMLPCEEDHRMAFGCADWVSLAVEEAAGVHERGFWFAMDLWTREIHWNRSIWKIDVIEEVERNENFFGEGGTRRWFMRRLHRKSPAPVTAGQLGDAVTSDAMEWASHYAPNHHELGSSTSSSHSLPHVVFSLLVPQAARSSSNQRATRYWPFHYPKAQAYRFTFDPAENHSGLAHLRYDVIPLDADLTRQNGGRDFEATLAFVQKGARLLLASLRKIARSYDVKLGRSTYEKRVYHDTLYPEGRYRENYRRLKMSYGFWVQQWPEKTDPVKSVFEELAIAAFLITLWEAERSRNGSAKLQSFADLGCGNGFLTYVLVSEGHPGVGFDRQVRSIWSMYPNPARAALIHRKLDMETIDLGDADWLLGNHSDELTPWIPLAAARVRTNFFVLPCCFWDFHGRLNFAQRVPDQGQGKYRRYLDFIEGLAREAGFQEVLRENLRIPSTKYVALLGRQSSLKHWDSNEVTCHSLEVGLT